MTDLTPSHPAVEAAMLEMTKAAGPLARTLFRHHALRDAAAAALNAAMPDLTDATEENLSRLRDTPVGRALMAKAWDEGARATNRAWEHAYDGHPVDPDFPYYECQTCDVANPYPEEIE